MKYLISLVVFFCAFTFAIAQSTAQRVALTLDVRQSANITVNHKAYSAIEFDGSVTDSVTSAGIDLTGKTGTIAFKKNLSDSAFFASSPLVITAGTSGLFTATMSSSQWATNVLVKTRFYGDVRISDFGNPLPSLDLWLYPSANAGTETNYVSPTSAGFEADGVLVSPLNRVNFGSGLTTTYVSTGTTSRLTLSVLSVAGSPIDSRAVTNNINLADHSITNGFFAGDGSGLTNLDSAAMSDFQTAVSTNADVVLNTAKISYPVVDSNKLDGIEFGATSNSTDAVLLARANHTGTQLASTISDFQTAVSTNADVVLNTAKISYPVVDTAV